jgi:hypothetical protein
MAKFIVDGVEYVDDENLIIVPVGYPDSIITKEHLTRKGECVVTCNMAVVDVMTKIGQTVSCPDCGKSFKVVRQEDVIQKPEAVTQQPEAVIQPPEAVSQPPDAVTSQPEAVTQPPEAVSQPPDVVKPQDKVVPKRKSSKRKSRAKSRKKSKK